MPGTVVSYCKVFESNIDGIENFWQHGFDNVGSFFKLTVSGKKFRAGLPEKK